MQVSDIAILVGGAVLIYFGIKMKYEQRTQQKERDRLFNEQTKKLQEVAELSNKVRNEITVKKEEYEKAKLKVFAVHDGDDDGNKPGDGK